MGLSIAYGLGFAGSILWDENMNANIRKILLTIAISMIS